MKPFFTGKIILSSNYMDLKTTQAPKIVIPVAFLAIFLINSCIIL